MGYGTYVLLALIRHGWHNSFMVTWPAQIHNDKTYMPHHPTICPSFISDISWILIVDKSDTKTMPLQVN